jgi:hypothetical protein
VKLTMDNLTCLATVKQVRQASENIPTSLTEVYRKTMDRILNHNPNLSMLAKRVLAWVSHARRPLRVEELRHALAVEKGASELDPENLCLMKTLLSACVGMIVVDKQRNTIRLVHLTAREYINEYGPNKPKEIETDITSTCMTYLSFRTIRHEVCDSISALEKLFKLHPFLDYAARYWGDHAQDVEEELKVELMKFLKDKDVVSISFKALHHEPQRDSTPSRRPFQSLPSGQSALHVVAYWNLCITAKELISNNIDSVSHADAHGWTPLHWAAARGHQDMTSLLVDQKANLEYEDLQGWTPIFWAVLKGQASMVNFLLKKGCDASRRDRRGFTLGNNERQPERYSIAGKVWRKLGVQRAPHEALAHR